MRGYFGIGIEGVSKKGNMGNLIRTGHAFGAAFAFTVNPETDFLSGETVTKAYADTSKTDGQIPFYEYDTISDMHIPKGCQLVGVELDDSAAELPEFRHPRRAVYILGGERTSLSEPMRERCKFLIKIPTKFSLNVATAGAIVMYDRLRCMGGFSERAVMPGQAGTAKPEHVSGGPIRRRLKTNDAIET